MCRLFLDEDDDDDFVVDGDKGDKDDKDDNKPLISKSCVPLHVFLCSLSIGDYSVVET